MAPDPEADEPRILEHKEALNEGIPHYTAHWHIFIPTVVIAILYSGAWITLAMLGKSDSGMARLFIVVMAVGVPLLAAHAFLRFETIRLQISDGRVLCHTGWPRDLPIKVPLQVIREMRVRRGLAGTLFGGGTLILELIPKGKISVTDLDDPEAAKSSIAEAIEEYNMSSTSKES